ncbi:MAG TPA: ABC transporter permease [Bryobacteraceae bacterium]|nr:ABC transporter permease [Bryobacteraceae bacterium]
MSGRAFWRRTAAVARKEALHVLRDRRSLGMALAVPLVMLLLFGYALTLDVDRIPTVIYDRDRSPESRELIERFSGSQYFQVLGSAAGYAPFERQVDRNRAMLSVVIPQDFSRELVRGGRPEVQLLFDGSDSNTASIALGYTEALLEGYAFELRRRWLERRGGGRLENPVEARIRVWYNAELKSRNFIVPGLIVVILMIIAALLTSLTIAREWEMGSMEQLLATPLRAQELVLGKMAAYFVLGLADMLAAAGAGVLVFGVPLRGNPLLVFASGCVFLIGALFWGIFLSAAARSQVLAYQMGMLTSFLPAFLLSGFIFAIENMPVVIQGVTYLFPSRYFVAILKGLFLKGTGLAVLWGEMALLAVYAAVVFLLAVRKVGRKLA